MDNNNYDTLSEYNQNDNKDNQNKQKKKRGCLRGFLIFLLIIIALISALIFALINLFGKDNDKEEILNDPSLSYNEMISNIPEEELNLDYDDDGLTNAEEIELETDIFNPDTDGDGIYDGTEVSMYNTDPLKFSTAGDDISDMAKIDAGLDPLKKVRGKIDSQTIKVENTEVSITTNDLNSLSMYIVKEVKVNDSDNKFLSKPVKVSDFKGTISIPFNSSAASNPAAYYYNEFTKQKLRIRDVEFNDGIANIEIKKEKSLPIVIMNSTIDSSASSTDIESVDGQFTVVELNTSWLIKFSRLVGTSSSELENEKDAIWIFRLGDSKSKLSEDDIRQAYPVIGERTIVYKETKYEKVYNTMVNAVKKGMSLTGDGVFNLGFVSINKYEGSLLSVLDSISDIYTKKNNSDSSNTGESAENITDDTSNKYYDKEDDRESLFGKTYNVRTDFKVGEDGFSFKNYGVLGKHAENGICAGFSLVSSLIFNNQGDTIPRTKERVVREYKYSYDLNDSYFNDLFEGKNIYSKYKVSIEEGETHYDLEKLKGNERVLIEFLEYYWRLYNSTKNEEYFFWAKNNIMLAMVGNKGVLGLDFTGRNSDIVKMADILESRIKNNKITSVGLSDSESGHALNIIGMKTNKDDADIIDLEVYDNNYPNNQKISGENISDRLYIRLILKEEKKNILGQKQVRISERYYYNTKESFQSDITKYNESYRDNLNSGAFEFSRNYMAIYDESKFDLNKK